MSMQLVKGHSGAPAQASDHRVSELSASQVRDRRAGRAASPIAPAVRSKIGQGVPHPSRAGSLAFHCLSSWIRERRRRSEPLVNDRRRRRERAGKEYKCQ